jgi:hypothetical protein
MIQTQREGSEEPMPAARDAGTKKPLQSGEVALQGF